MHRFLSVLLAFALAAVPTALSSAQTPASGKTLDIYFIDTEGGQSTLSVSPSGQTMLVDTGNAGDRDLGRILEILNIAGVRQIDHLFLTHYHGDHYGSLPALAERIPIRHFYDHGESVEKDRPNVAAFLAAYAGLVQKGVRTIVKPGDTVAFAGADVRVVVSDGNVLQKPIAGAPDAGAPNAACASFKERDESKVDPDNHRSAGFVMAYGRFRTINMGDFTWNREFTLMCPTNPIGTVDLYLTTHHGVDSSGSAAFVHAVRPRVAIMNNGLRKGGHVQTYEILGTSPGLEDLWQLHWSSWGGTERNPPNAMIANLEEAAGHSPAHYLKVAARADGSFTVTNSRTGHSKTYDARR